MEAAETLRSFFQRIWADSEGLVYLPTRSKDNSWRKYYFEWPAKPESVVDHVLQQTALGNEVYYAPSLFGPEVLPTVIPETVPGKGPTVLPGKAPNKYAVKECRVLWADFDGSKEGDSTPAPEDWAKLSDIIQEPSIRIQTSSPTNQHCLWILEKPETDIQWIEEKNRAIAYSVDSDKSVWDAARLLRPPESINYGYAKPERKGATFPVEVVESLPITNPPEAFNHLKSIRLLVEQAIVLNEKPPVEDVMMGCKWTDHMMRLFKAGGENTPHDRSGALVSLAMQAAEIGWKDAEIYAIIEHADRRWGKYYDRTDREQLLTSIVERARRKHPVGSENLTFAGLLGDSGSEAQLNPKVSYKYGEFRKLKIQLDWHFKGLMPHKGYGFITAAPGTGKTQLLLQLGKAVATGSNFLQWENVSGPHKVQFLSLEMAGEPLREFTNLQDTAYSDRDMELIDENFIVTPIGESIPMQSDAGRKFFESQLEEHRPKVMLVDSFGAFTSSSLIDEQPNRELNSYLQRIRKKFDVTICIVHHNNKSRPLAYTDQADMFGSVYVYTGADFVLSVGIVDQVNGIYQVNHAKSRLGRTLEPFRIIRDPSLTYTVVEESDVVRNFSSNGGSSALIKDLLR